MKTNFIRVDPKPRVGYYHYSNPASQGALITNTAGFPKSIDPSKWAVTDGYIDRIEGWYPEGYKRASAMLKTSIPYALPSLDDDKLQEFAQSLFEMKQKPQHVMAIYYYNVATGYDCPYFIVLTELKAEGHNAKAK